MTTKASGLLSHLIGAYWLFLKILCDCEPKKEQDYRQMLLHLIGIFWLVMKMKFGIQNPKKEIQNDGQETRKF